MFLHARQGHVEPLGKGCDRSVRTPELLQNAASGGVRERAERGIEVGLTILSHMVQYNNIGDGMQGRLMSGEVILVAATRIAADLAEEMTTDDRVKDRLGGWRRSEMRRYIYQDRVTDELRTAAAVVRR